MMTATARLPFADEELPTIPKARISHGSRGKVPSLMKWTGSKRSQAGRIAALAPPFERYYEPFVGGGALL